MRVQDVEVRESVDDSTAVHKSRQTSLTFCTALSQLMNDSTAAPQAKIPTMQPSHAQQNCLSVHVCMQTQGSSYRPNEKWSVRM